MRSRQYIVNIIVVVAYFHAGVGFGIGVSVRCV